MEQPVIQILNQDGSASRYKRVSARMPEFLAKYGPDKGYRVLSSVTDYLDVTTGRFKVLLAQAQNGNLPSDVAKQLWEDRKMVFTAKLANEAGDVVAEASAIKPIFNMKDYEIGETAALQRLMAKVGFGGEIFDTDEDEDLASIGQPLDEQSATPAVSTATVSPIKAVPKPETETNASEEVQESVSKDAENANAAEQQQGENEKQTPRGKRVDPDKIQPAQLRQLQSLARVKGVECPKVTTPKELQAELARLHQLPMPE